MGFNPLTKYLISIAVIAATLSIQQLLRPLVGSLQLFLLFPAVSLISSVLGFRPAVFAIAMGALGAKYFLIPPIGTFAVERPVDFYRILLFASTSYFIVWLMERKKKTEYFLQESMRSFKLLADAMPQLVWVTDLEGGIEYINERWYEYTGQEKGSASRKTWGEVTHPDDRERVFQMHEKALRDRSEFAVEYRLRRHDGEYRWHLARTVFVNDQHGKVSKRFGTATDIHDQKMLLGDLEKAVKTRDSFVSIASHELKTPLTSLQLQTQMKLVNLKKGNENAFSSERMEKMLNNDLRQFRRINRLIDDMLDVSRINAGKLNFEPEEFDLSELVRDVCMQFQSTAQAQGVSVVLGKNEHAMGKWDRFRIEQVLLNLLTNALRYGETKPIYVDVTATEQEVTVSVRDEGLGIAKQDQTRIFNRFERAVSANEVSGMGLGLYISREIVRAHRGEISVESELNRGSKFSVKLPR